MSKFNPEDFKAVIDFAKAANGDRSINWWSILINLYTLTII
jgi:hypothetical protein